jgi:hypothetical protein
LPRNADAEGLPVHRRVGKLLRLLQHRRVNHYSLGLAVRLLGVFGLVRLVATSTTQVFQPARRIRALEGFTCTGTR